MILFLRNNENRTIVDIECFVKTEDEHSFIELLASVIIDEYSKFLLENLDKKDEIINDFEALSDLRGWLWKKYFVGSNNDPEEYQNVITELRILLKGVANKYNLSYVED
jgi:hypothetical protein